MATSIDGTSRIVTSESDVRLAQHVLSDLDGEDGFLAVGRPKGTSPLPRELGVLLQQILDAIAHGKTVTISSLPEDLTTSAAASLLGVSRPTVVKLIRDGVLPAHKVGSHHRIKSRDVLALRRERRQRERAAFEALLELEGDEE